MVAPCRETSREPKKNQELNDGFRDEYAIETICFSTGTCGRLARFLRMAILFSQPARYAPDPPGLILSAAEAARQAMLRALPPPRRAGR